MTDKNEATDQEKSQTNGAAEYEPGVRPPEAEHTFALRTLNSVEKPDFDGPSSPAATIHQVYRIEREGGRLSPEGLGHMAGASVLAQYRAAKAEVGARWWQFGSHLFGGAALTYAVPVVALIAGGAIDVAIFGGAAEELMRVSPWFKSLAAGSLVFAAGVGLSQHKGSKAFLAGLLVTASIGASMLAADNPNFKSHFANMLPNTLRSQVYASNQDLAVAQAHVTSAQKKLDADTLMLNTGGVGGKPILGDGYAGNDAQGHQLENITIPEDNVALRAANEEVARASSSMNVANAESPASWWGQILGAAYLSAWLIASQLVVAKVIDSANSNLKAGRKETAQRRLRELFVRDLESSRGEAAAKVAIGDMLHRYRDAMTNACRKNPIAQEVKSRLAELDKLFSGEDIEKAMQTGTQMVKDAVHPYREKFEEDDRNRSGLMGTVVSLGQRRKSASGNPPHNPPAP